MDCYLHHSPLGESQQLPHKAGATVATARVGMEAIAFMTTVITTEDVAIGIVATMNGSGENGSGNSVGNNGSGTTAGGSVINTAPGTITRTARMAGTQADLTKRKRHANRMLSPGDVPYSLN